MVKLTALEMALANTNPGMAITFITHRTGCTKAEAKEAIDACNDTVVRVEQVYAIANNLVGIMSVIAEGAKKIELFVGDERLLQDGQDGLDVVRSGLSGLTGINNDLRDLAKEIANDEYTELGGHPEA